MGAARSTVALRATFALAAVVATAVIASGGATAAGSINAKHFFWAPGQSPQGTVASVENDIIYHGGNAGPGAIGIQKTPAVYLIYWGAGPTASPRLTRTDSSIRARPSRTT
jgi:hypothetical protein